MIARAFEWKFVAKFAGIVLGGVACVYLSLLLALPRIEGGYYADVIRSLVAADTALSRAILIALAAEAILIPAAVLAIAVLTSHKIAGPVYRLRVALEAVAKGRGARPISLREGDQLGKTAEAFNAMLGELQDRFRSIETACAEVSAEAAREAGGPPGSREELKGRIERLREALERLDR